MMGVLLSSEAYLAAKFNAIYVGQHNIQYQQIKTPPFAILVFAEAPSLAIAELVALLFQSFGK